MTASAQIAGRRRRTTSRFAGPRQSPGFMLWCVGNEWRRGVEQALAPTGLTQPHFVILAATAWLSRGGRLTIQAEIGRFAAIDPNTVSAALRSLERRGLVTRSRSSDDRAKNPSPTETGAALLADALTRVEDFDTHYFAALDDREAFVAALGRLAHERGLADDGDRPAQGSIERMPNSCENRPSRDHGA